MRPNAINLIALQNDHISKICLCTFHSRSFGFYFTLLLKEGSFLWCIPLNGRLKESGRKTSIPNAISRGRCGISRHTQTPGWFRAGLIHHTHTQAYGAGAGEQVCGGTSDLRKMDSSQERVMERRMTDVFPWVQSQQCRPGTLKRSPHCSPSGPRAA